ncbi:hypothetical protein [Corynebacterium propinquum]|nr:hypothetical protein [Corynebacterium propinquum]
MNRSTTAFHGALAMAATVLTCSLALVTAAPAVHARESSPTREVA